jgi:hypothetical protein
MAKLISTKFSRRRFTVDLSVEFNFYFSAFSITDVVNVAKLNSLLKYGYRHKPLELHDTKAHLIKFDYRR